MKKWDGIATVERQQLNLDNSKVETMKMFVV